MADQTIAIDTILRIVEIIGLGGTAVGVVFRFGRSTNRMEATIQSVITKTDANVANIADRMESALSGQREEIHELKEEFRGFREVMTQVALQKQAMETMQQQIATLDRRYEELRHGEGYVFPLNTHLGPGSKRG